jgi:hypothetical protein
MTSHEQALEVRAVMMHEALKWAYEQIPESLRKQSARANQSGQYAVIWPDPKPPSVERFLRWHEAWANVKRELDESRPVDLTLKKVRRTP